MKDSGVAWIGEIPEEWNLDKLGNYFTERKEKVSDIDYQPLSVSKGGIVQQLDGVAKTKNNDDRKRVAKGDFAINSRSDRKQSCGLSSLDGSVSVINTVLIPRNIEPDFVKYLLDNYGFAEEFFRWGSGIHFDLWSTRFTQMKSILLPVPNTKEEQQKIASYLDQKVSLIDNIIEKTKQSIEEYKKYKQSLITETVTKGLNPDVKMKDSGIAWIGEIPEHWSMSKIKREFDNMDGKRKPIDASLRNREGEILYDYYGASGVIDRIDDYIFDEDLLLIGEDGANLVMRNLPLIYLATGKYWVNNHAHVLKPKLHNSLFYMANYLETIDLTNYITGSAQPKLSQANLNVIPVVVPPFAEQQKIVDFLESKVAYLDDLLIKKNQLISNLEAYKKSLIYEVVTGKKEIS